LSNVLTVPITSLYSSGPDTYVFVKNAPDPTPRKVTVGATNETQAQILSGLNAGEQVLILQSGQGRDLLAKAGIKETPATRPSDIVNGKNRGGRNGGEQPAPAAAPTPVSAVEKKTKAGA
jgi:hypothetical protein